MPIFLEPEQVLRDSRVENMYHLNSYTKERTEIVNADLCHLWRWWGVGEASEYVDQDMNTANVFMG